MPVEHQLRCSDPYSKAKVTSGSRERCSGLSTLTQTLPKPISVIHSKFFLKNQPHATLFCAFWSLTFISVFAEDPHSGLTTRLAHQGTGWSLEISFPMLTSAAFFLMPELVSIDEVVLTRHLGVLVLAGHGWVRWGAPPKSTLKHLKHQQFM